MSYVALPLEVSPVVYSHYVEDHPFTYITLTCEYLLFQDLSVTLSTVPFT